MSESFQAESAGKPGFTLTGTAHDGTTTLPSVPTGKFVFGRKVGKGKR